DGDALSQFDEAEQKVFGADHVVIEPVGFLARQCQHLLRARREIAHAFFAHIAARKVLCFARIVQHCSEKKAEWMPEKSGRPRNNLKMKPVVIRRKFCPVAALRRAVWQPGGSRFSNAPAACRRGSGRVPRRTTCPKSPSANAPAASSGTIRPQTSVPRPETIPCPPPAAGATAGSSFPSTKCCARWPGCRRRDRCGYRPFSAFSPKASGARFPRAR